ncbi:hypothetical protein BJV78DRAFT_807834 [Lactifluus subvellereus]|nr:hypothetical protein BJV78DRAFT_807834 [Lactifluus subvellereus]
MFLSFIATYHAFSLDRPASPLLSEAPLAETCDLWPAVTIEATVEGDFGGLAALERNRIFELHGTEPDFLMEFRTKLRQRRWIESDTNPAVLVLKNKLHEFDNYFEDAPTDVGQRDRVSSEDELLHLAYAFYNKDWEDSNVIKEENVRWDFVQLGWYFHSVLGSRERHAFRADWPFKLIISIESQQKYRYTPRSDFHVSVDRLVSLMVEVQSDKNQSDRNRMLLQAACAARLGHLSYNHPFIVVALYIENSGRVTRYFLFQRDDADPKVSYVSDVQDWRQPSDLFIAIFEIYNLVSMIQSDRPELGNIQERIGLLCSDLSKNFNDTFMTHCDTSVGVER